MRIRAVYIRTSLIFAVMIAGLVPGSVFAQGQNGTQRRELFENLLQSLIDSRMDGVQQQQPQQFYGPPVDRRPPAQDQETRRLVNNFSQEAIRLFDAISTDSRQNPSMRSLLNPTLEVQASATILGQLISQNSDWATVRQEFTTLDRNWRLLSHRLQSTISLSTTARNSVKAMDTIDTQLSKIFDVSPQVDNREFLRLTDTLKADLQSLLDDIAIELGQSQQARQLLVQGRLIEQQVRFMANAIEYQQSHEIAVAEFKKFHELWGPFAAQLWPLNNRYLERSLQRIEQADRELHEILWIDIPVDNTQLSRLTTVLTTDIETLFQTTTLRQLLDMQSRDTLLRSATELHAANKRLTESISQNRNLQQLQADFRIVDQKWRQLEASYSTCNQREILRLIKTTDQTMVSIQQALQVGNVFDHDLAMQILASLENYGEHLQEAFSTKVLPKPQYNRQFSIQGLHTSQQFTAFARNIHYDLAAGSKPEDVRARCDTLVRGWNYLNGEYIHKLNGREREDLNRLSSQITPLIVQLQTMFEV